MRVVATAGIGDDGEQRAALARQELGAGGQVEAPLPPDGVVGAVALVEIARVVKERVDRLVALEIDDAHDLSARDLARESAARGHHFVEDRVAWIERALYERVIVPVENLASR